MSDPRPRTLFEAEAYGAATRLLNHLGAATNALAELGYALDAAGLADFTKEAAKIDELHRLCVARAAALARRIGEGG